MTITTEPTLETLKLALKTWVKDATGLDRVIWANQSIARPDLPYAALNIISYPMEIGQPERRVLSATGGYVYENVENQQMTLSVNVYTEPSTNDAFLYLQKLNQSVRINYWYEYLRNNSLSLFDKSVMRNIDQQLGDRWEKRAQQDYTFRFRTRTLESISIIETISGTGTYETDSGGEQINKEFSLTL